MATLKQQKNQEFNKTIKCNKCRTHKALIHFDERKKDDRNNSIYRRECIECRGDKEDDRNLENKRKARAKREEEESDTGKKYCKPCKSTLDLTAFETKMNGGIYQQCFSCRNKAKAKKVA